MPAPRTTRLAALAAALLLPAAISACGGGGSPAGPASGSPTVSGTAGPSSAAPGATASGGTSGGASGGPAATTPATVQASVYFLDGEHLSPAHRRVVPPGTAAGAVRALLTGPSAAERAAGRGTAIPPGTALRGLSVHAATATVDLSGRFDDGGGSASLRARLAQVVFTVTQYPAIQRVSFALDGKPVKVFGGEGLILDHPVNRADFEDVTPAVLVESPALGDTVRSPLRVRGTANVFEARFRLRLTDASGHTVADVPVQATSGTGTRGSFDVTLRFPGARTGRGLLTAYYSSPKDGSPVTVARVPVELTR